MVFEMWKISSKHLRWVGDGDSFPAEGTTHTKTLRHEAIICSVSVSRIFLALCFAMVYVLCWSYFTGADISPFLLNRRDIVLLIHSHLSPPMNRMWAGRTKSNYFSTWAYPEQSSFGVLVLWSVCSHHTTTSLTWWNDFWKGHRKYLRKRRCDNF